MKILKLLWYSGLFVFLGLILTQCKTTKPVNPETQQIDYSLASSLLWKIEGSDIQTSYLFGTIHLIDEENYFFTSAMASAFDSCKVLALEFDLEEAMDLGNLLDVFQQAFMRNDTTLRDLLSEEEYALVESHFKEIGIPILFLDRLKPMFLNIFGSNDFFSGGELRMEDFKSYEMELMSMAQSKQRSIEGLESVEYQMSIFDSIPYKAQADMLMQTIKSGQDDSEIMDTLFYYYKEQNLMKLDALINQDGPTRKYRRILLDNRNRNWIPIMVQLMKLESTFFAVGAGHLAGEYGVIHLLSKEGLKITPVY
jgi:uncharacterized protein YbaP (TraB family)